MLTGHQEKKKKHLHPQMKSLMLDNTSLFILWKYESMLGEEGRRKIGLFMLLTFLVKKKKKRNPDQH